MKAIRRQKGFVRTPALPVKQQAVGYWAKSGSSGTTVVEAACIIGLLAYFAGCFYAVLTH